MVPGAGFDFDERRRQYAVAILAKLGFRLVVPLTSNTAHMGSVGGVDIGCVAPERLSGLVRPEGAHDLQVKSRRFDNEFGDASQFVVTAS